MTTKEIRPADTYPWFTRRRNMAWLIAGFFLISATVALLLGYHHYQDLRQRLLQDDQATAGLHALILEEHFKRLVKTMESYAHRPLLIDAARGRNAAKAREHLIDLTRENPEFESIIIADQAGTLWASQPVRKDVMGKNFAHRGWYLGVSRQWTSYISDATLRVTGEKDTAVFIAVPILDRSGKAIGVLVDTQRAVDLSETIRRVPLEPGSSISITDRMGVIIFSSRYSYIKSLAHYPFFNEVKSNARPGVHTSAVSDPLTGHATRYLSYATVDGIGWHVFIGRDMDAIHSAAAGYIISLALITLLLFAFLSLFLIYIRKRVIAQATLESLSAEQHQLAVEARFRELYDHMSSGVAIYNAVNDGEDFLISDMNAAAQRITGVTRDFTGRSVRKVFPAVVEFGLFPIFQQVWRTGVAAHHSTSLYADQALSFWADNYVYKLPSGQIVAIFDDVTERKRADEKILRHTRLLSAINRLFSETLRTDNTKTVAETCLALAQEITESPLGFIGELSPDGLHHTISLSNPGWGACHIPGTQAAAMIHNMTVRGIWGQVILQRSPLVVNDPAVFPERVGLPEGHPPLTSFLGVPLANQDQVIGMIALANRPSGYTDEQREDLEALAVAFTESLRRNRAEEKVRQMYLELEERVTKRTHELAAKNAELERLNRVFVDRELRMRELKERIEELEKKV